MSTYIVRGAESYDGTTQNHVIEADSYTVDNRSLLEFYRRSESSGGFDTIASYAPGQWVSVVKEDDSDG